MTGGGAPAPAPAKPRLAVLFWCYKDPVLSRDRLQLLRRHNPTAPIYVLFGGDPASAPSFQRAFAGLIDDFYVFDDPPPPGGPEHLLGEFREGVYWKYYYGDLLFAAWYRDRGRELAWDTVCVVQWDMLVYGPIEQVFGCLERDEVLFSGLRPIREVEDRWLWTAESRPIARRLYLEFLDHVRERHGLAEEPLCCVAIVLCLSRSFLDAFAGIERPELGFMEYRLPVYAQVFGIPIRREHPFRPWWGAVEPFSFTSALRARPCEVWAPAILANLLRSGGARVFHPYWRPAPQGALGWSWALLDSLPRLVHATLTKPHCRPWSRHG